jgi:uncharacterized protein YycO
MIPELLPGDLVLYRISSSSNWLDKAIGIGQRWIHQAPTKANYCHVAIIAEDSRHIYEAVWPKVHRTVFNPETIEKNLILEYYRVKDSTPEQVDKVLAYCRGEVGQWYSVSSIITFGFIDIGHRPYCSLMAWRAWLAAYRELCPDEKMVSPDVIAASTIITGIA